MLDKVLKERIREYAAERNIFLTDEQVEQALKGVRFWFDVTVDESISTAIDEVI